jgi:hypothetical protein
MRLPIMFIIAIGAMSKVLQRVATYAIVIALSRIEPKGQTEKTLSYGLTAGLPQS